MKTVYRAKQAVSARPIWLADKTRTMPVEIAAGEVFTLRRSQRRGQEVYRLEWQGVASVLRPKPYWHKAIVDPVQVRDWNRLERLEVLI